MSDLYIKFLEERGAGKVRHGNRSLLDHLTGTHDLLKKWKDPPYIQIAGLFHSVYGTAWFKPTLIPFSDRDEIKHLIGEEAELLAYLFCATDRKFFNREVKLLNSSDSIQLSVKQMYDLMEIEAANLVDQNCSPLKIMREFQTKV